MALGIFAASPAFAGPDLAVDVQVFDDVDTCDQDGVLDVGEVGRVVVLVRNLMDRNVGDVLVVVKPSEGALMGWNEVRVPKLEAFGVAVVEFELEISEAQASQLRLQTIVSAPESENVERVALEQHFRMNIDEAVGVSPFDDVEFESSAWRPRHDGRYGAGSGWSRGVDEDSNHVWFVVGSALGTHASLESPVMYPAHGEDFIFSFKHRYEMMAPGSGSSAGGVIEISTDGGQRWEDASNYAEIEYDGKIDDHAGDLEGRIAFVGVNNSLPARDEVFVNFGTTFQGDYLQLRFRMAAEPGERAAGWELDDFEVRGSYNTPFNAVVEHRGKCIPKAGLSGKPFVNIYLPDDPKGDAEGFVFDANIDAAVEAPHAPGVLVANDEAKARVLVAQARPFQAEVRKEAFGRIDGGQIVAAGCSAHATAPGSMPFAMALVMVGWGLMSRRRR